MKTIASTSLPAHVQQTGMIAVITLPIVHFGFGAFHRAHQALLTNRLLNEKGGDWGICEISLFSGDVLMGQLRGQDHIRLPCREKGAEGNQPIIVGAVHECLNAKLTPCPPLLRNFVSPRWRLYRSPSPRKATASIPRPVSWIDKTRIQRDLDNPAEPHSAPGILVEALHRRRERGLPAFTVLSCDNIPDKWPRGEKCRAEIAQKRSRRWRSGSKATRVFRARWSTELFPRRRRPRLQKSPMRSASTIRVPSAASRLFSAW